MEGVIAVAARDMTALIADISHASAARTAAMLEALGYSCVIASDGGKAFRLCERECPGLVVTDAVLPVIDGAGLAARIRASGVISRPGIVICVHPGLECRVSLPGVAVMEKPLAEDALAKAIGDTALARRIPGRAFSARIGTILDELGVPAHPGRSCLEDAVFLACEDMRLISRLTARLYPMVAARIGMDAAAVERAMRHAIEKAWSDGSIEKQYDIFRETIDAARGKPTCGGMIAQLTEMLRMEV